MGCVVAKPSMNSTKPRGLEKLKLENGYVRGGGGLGGARRSTGQRPLSRDPTRVPRTSSALGGGARGSDAGRGGGDKKLVNGDSGGQEEKMVTRDSGRGGSGGGRRGGRLKVEEEVVDGWPKWLSDNIPKEALAGLVPRSADSYAMLDKVGQGTYSNVYKAQDKETGKIVALKKVKFDTSEPESVKFMAREITILQKLDHPNIVKLEGLATSRMQYSIYLVFDYMVTDLSRIISRPDDSLTEPQVKCYMEQLLSGLKHCHERGILHRDIKGSNLLIDKNGLLKIADFGLAKCFNPEKKRPLTSRVVTLWYRAPELLLGSTDYGIGIDLWSAGCLMAEMFVGRPILPGRTEVEQLHRIFKLCGTPSEEYWKKLKVSTTFRPPRSYKPNLRQSFCDFPSSSLGLLHILLALDPVYRGNANSALKNEFFYTSPLACDLSGLPVIFKEDDNPAQILDKKKHRRSYKMRQRSKTQQERLRKDQPLEIPQGEYVSLKEEQAKAQTQVLINKEESPLPPLLSPDMSPKSDAHPRTPNSIKNKPPMPIPKTRSTKYNNDSQTYKISQVQRSVSTREFRRLDQRKYNKLHALDG
ncbi:hypothetical protein LguiA_004242 [Lonicera macranthoides]